jgi:hypothetical protein
MTDQPSQPPGPPSAPPPPPQQPGLIGRLEERLLPHAEHAVQDAEAGGLRLTADFAGALQGHAGEVFDLAGDVVGLLKLVDPADDAAVAALAALIPKAYAITASVTRLAQAALGKVVTQG